MKVYITKWALEDGIVTMEADDLVYKGNTIIIKNTFNHYFHGDDWHKTKKEAIARAEIMRAKKIESLKKQISKLESIDFNKQIKEANHG